MKLLLLCICFLIFTSTEVLAVSINEVAWMGDSISANYEWIELYNDAETVDISGWTLSDGMNLNIELIGELKANTYVLLERKRTDEKYLTTPPFFIYTGALVNTGATLVLKNAVGEIIDQVAGGENWENIGGDNVTKETAQYSLGGWVTGVGTPRLNNVQGRVPVEAGVDTKGIETIREKSRTVKNQTTIVIPPNVLNLQFNIEYQKVAYVGQEVRFLARPKSIVGKSTQLRFKWNFGDTYSSSGTEVQHVYQHPGEYVVTTYVQKGLEEQLVLSEITVVPISLSVSFDQGVVHLNNNSPYDIDVSGYSVVAEKTVEFPERSIIKNGGTITLSESELGSFKDNVQVFNTKGVVVHKIKFEEDSDLSEEINVSQIIEQEKEELVVDFKNDQIIPEITYPVELSRPTSNGLKKIYIAPENSNSDKKENRVYSLYLAILIFFMFGFYLFKFKV